MASAGIGHTTHVAGELFKRVTGIDMTYVPYRGGAPALTDLIGGQVQAYFGLLPASIEYIKTGKLRALGVTTTARAEALPTLPTVAEFVPGYEATSWFGIGAPKSTPVEITDRLKQGDQRCHHRSQTRKHGSAIWAALSLRVRPPTSASSLPMIRINGAR